MKSIVLLLLCMSAAVADGIPRVCADAGPKARFATKVFRIRSVTLNGIPLDSASREKIWMARPGAPDAIKPFVVLDGAVLGDEKLDSKGVLQSFTLVEPVNYRPVSFVRKTVP